MLAGTEARTGVRGHVGGWGAFCCSVPQYGRGQGESGGTHARTHTHTHRGTHTHTHRNVHANVAPTL